MKISQLLETLDAPKFQRRSFLEYLRIDIPETVTCYHVTEAKNADSIRANGLKAYECQQGRVNRQAACYLFVDKDDINQDTIKILGIENPITLEVKLSIEQLLDNACYDGMFNVTFDCAYSAIMYLDNIPSELVK